MNDTNIVTKSKKGQATGQLFVVATPIGNLDDFSDRAKKILSSVSVILAEDTRHSKRLLNHFGITTRLRSCHEHNEEQQVDWVIEQLSFGHDLALISDAGTPLISDPGFVLVRALREQGFSVCTVPGPSSIIAALSIAGLATDRFLFDGFLPSKSVARSKQFADYLGEGRTIVLFESSHRILASLKDCAEVLGESRRVVIARELTKRFETVLDGSLAEVIELIEQDDDQTRGEFVVMLEGVKAVSRDEREVRALLTELVLDLPLKKAAGIVAKLTGRRKNDIYDLALVVKKELES